jgi:hypothetical protein
MYQTTLSQLKKTIEFFKKNPESQIQTGMWNMPVWNKEKFYSWFYKCLNEKINRELPKSSKSSKMSDEYFYNLKFDRQTIEDYLFGNIRHSGSSQILRTSMMKKRYPFINCQVMEY